MKVTCVALFCLFAVAAAVSLPEEAFDEESEYGIKDFAKLIERFGADALHFLKCMGPTFITHCGKQTVSCLKHALAHDFLNCMQLLECEGHDASNCLHHLHDKTNVTKAPGYF